MANSGDMTAVNEEKIDSCILEMTSYIERIKTVFSRIDDVMNRTEKFYRCENADSIRNKYSLFRDNYNVIVMNFMGYVDELKAVKLGFGKFNDELSAKISKTALELEGQHNRYDG